MSNNYDQDVIDIDQIEKQLDDMYNGDPEYIENCTNDEINPFQKFLDTRNDIEEQERLNSYSNAPTFIPIKNKDNPNYFSFKEYLDSDKGKYFNIIHNNIFLNNNNDYITEGLSYIDKEVDLAIVCMYSENSIGISSSIFEAFELYQMLKINNLPPDLGGPVIRLIFTDYLVNENGFATKTNLGPNKNYGNEILKAIFIKYDGTEVLLKDMQREIIFLNRPKEIIIKKSNLPYPSENYVPTNLIIIDGPTSGNINCLYNIKLEADNLHLPISDQIGFGLELFNSQKDNTNFFCLYLDKRLSEYIHNLYMDNPRIYLFNDIKRIGFRFFKYTDLIAKDPEYNYDRVTIEKFKKDPKRAEEFLLKNTNYKRYLLYLTPKSRAIKKIETINTENGIITMEYPTSLLDDIIDSLRSTDLNPIAKYIKDERNEFKNTSKKFKSMANPELVKEVLDSKKFYTSTKYTLDDILNDKISVHFVIIGLNEESRDFEEALLSRALLRGINATSEVYLFNQLPLENIHSLYDVYIYTPTMRDWDASPRFIPEAIYYGKKLYFTKLARKETTGSGKSQNMALITRIKDVEKHLGFIDEDDVYYFPKMQLTRNLLGYWPTQD